MNEQLKHSLQQIAADNIPDDVNWWPGVRWHLRSQAQQPRQQQQTYSPSRWRTVGIGAAVAAFLFAATLVASPPARAWSESVVDQLFTRFGFNRQTYVPQTTDDVRLPGLTEGQITRTITCDGQDLRISTSNPAGFTIT